MRVAIVYDHLNKIGGAEVVLENFHKLYPTADWYTSVWNKSRTSFTTGWNIHTSWLNYIPWLRNHHELVPFLMPFIFESFDLSEYDLVISVGAMAKGVITRADTLHINYCLTPTRYLWSHRELYLTRPQFGWLQKIFTPAVTWIFDYLARWDLIASTRPDHMISISHHVKKRVQKYYSRESKVIYPPVNLKKFISPLPLPTDPCPLITDLSPYYLAVSRLVPYKNLAFLIRVFRNTNRQLIIVGTGSELSRLRKLATDNIQLVGHITDSQLLECYQHCQAFLQTNIEDFGISMVEALATGAPVIAYQEGGAGEIVDSDTTGILVPKLTIKAFHQALDKFEAMDFSPAKCKSAAKHFDSVKWQNQIKSYISNAYAKTIFH